MVVGCSIVYLGVRNNVQGPSDLCNMLIYVKAHILNSLSGGYFILEPTYMYYVSAILEVLIYSLLFNY